MAKFTSGSLSARVAFAAAFVAGFAGGCQCTGTGFESEHYACTTDRDCLDGYLCFAGFCERIGSIDGGCEAVAEVCGDDVDDNCNGVLDDGCPCTGASRPCYREGLGSPSLRYPWDGGAGCAVGTQACVGGVLAASCQNERPPQLEFCDGVDTDCDGLPDPVNCPCQQGRPCYQGLPYTVNANTAGLSTCRPGVWDCTVAPGLCVGQVLPAAREVCDGFDDDCNGAVDDQADTDSCGPGVCATTFKVCAGGAQPACDLNTIAEHTAAEVCNDGLDNNCDGQVEENCACTPDAGIACWTGSASECPADGGACKGICRRGQQSCIGLADGGTSYTSCLGSVQATIENCSNGSDDDCDGLSDCADSSCAGRSCNATGKICSGSTCQCVLDGGTVQSVETNCTDGKDNDCDGLTDCAELVCNGVDCGQGKRCSGFQCVLVDGGTPQTTETICNDGFDNDNDGTKDCLDSSCANRTCAPNGFTCQQNACSCGGGGSPQAVETNCSDGLDNDCDTFIDCADPGCLTDAGVCTAELNCMDGMDNDQDGRTDCADTDCSQRRCSTSLLGAVCCGPYPAQPNTATCTNLSNDPNNCGGCGTVCPSGACNTVTSGGHTSGRCGCDGGFNSCPVSPGGGSRQSCSSSGQCDCNDDNDKCSDSRGAKCADISGADLCYYSNGGN